MNRAFINRAFINLSFRVSSFGRAVHGAFIRMSFFQAELEAELHEVELIRALLRRTFKKPIRGIKREHMKHQLSIIAAEIKREN